MLLANSLYFVWAMQAVALAPLFLTQSLLTATATEVAGDSSKGGTFGGFALEVVSGEKSTGMAIVITRLSDGINVWRSAAEVPFLRLGNGTVASPPIVDGNYQLHEEIEYLSNTLTVDAVEKFKLPDGNEAFTISGQLLQKQQQFAESSECDVDNGDCPATTTVAHYTLQFASDVDIDGNSRVSFSAKAVPTVVTATTSVTAAAGDESLLLLQPRLFFAFQCTDEEHFYGFGESFSYFDLRGLRVPILVSEQGVGRGEEPITTEMNTAVAEGSGGYWYTTYAPKPIFLTNENRGFYLQNSEVMFFDLTAAPAVEIEVWALEISGFLWAPAATLLDLVTAITAVTGRQKPLPMWSQRGAVVGLEGGTRNVTSIVDAMTAAGVPVAGVWLQDWVGLQHNWDGDRLIWNWEVNYEHYPGWQRMVSNWHERDIRVLTYISPFFSDPSQYISNASQQLRNNFFQQGIDNNYFVHHPDGSSYLMQSLSITFAMVDLTNPLAVQWMKNIIIEHTLKEGRSSGWMCDFGEYLPFDAVLYSGESAASFHNRYPEEWAKLTAAAVAEAQLLYSSGSDSSGDSRSEKMVIESEVLYFMRSAWTQSPAYVPVFWLGDQLVSWDANDGLKSVLTGALSSGLTGHAITHSDIGGYTIEDQSSSEKLTYIRTPELLQRWSEHAAFGFGLFRTHIGSSTNEINAQVYDSPESIAHFAEFASIFGQLANYRMLLMKEAQEKGYPLVRPLAAYYGDDAEVWNLTEEFSFGADFLVAPCMEEGATSVAVYFPMNSGPWIHIWSGKEISVPLQQQKKGVRLDVPASIGFPPVFYKRGSQYGIELRAFLIEKGYTAGYQW